MTNARTATLVRRGTLALCVPLLAACGSEAAGRPEVVELDSAGVLIVENPSVREGGRTFAVVDPEPLLSLGSLDGDEADQLFRVWGAHRFDDGRLVIVNAGSNELRFFDGAGRHLRSVGGEGEGPGEFRNPVALWAVRGDSLLVYDGRNRVFSVFDRTGGLGRSYAPEGEATFRLVMGFLPDGSSVTQKSRVYGARDETSGLARSPLSLDVHDPEGRLVGSLGEWPGNEMFVHTVEGRGVAVRGLTFGRQLFAAVSGDRVVVGTSDEPSFEIVDRSGVLQRVVRIDEAPVPIEEGAFERVRDEALEQSANEEFRRMWRRMFDDMPRHETYPAFSELRSDLAGRIWLADYRVGDDERRMWSVFDPEGRALGRVRTPDGMRVLQIGEDYLVGVLTDELDVERVRVHALRAPEELETADGGP